MAGGGAMRAALEALVERHAVLRTTYEVGADGGFAQRVQPRVDGELLSEASAASEEAATALVSADASRGFELLGAGAAVLRGVLVRVDAEPVAARDESAHRQRLLLQLR